MSQALIDALTRARLRGDMVAVGSIRSSLVDALGALATSPAAVDEAPTETVVRVVVGAAQAVTICDALKADDELLQSAQRSVEAYLTIAERILQMTPDFMAWLPPDGHADLMAAGVEPTRLAASMRKAQVAARIAGAAEDAELFRRAADHANALTADSTRN